MTDSLSQDFSQSPPVIQRSRRTYGRPKPLSQLDPDTLVSRATNDTPSPDISRELSISKTDDELPPNSDEFETSTSFDTCMNNNGSDDEEEGLFQFEWKKKLLAMDRDDADFTHIQIKNGGPLDDDMLSIGEDDVPVATDLQNEPSAFDASKGVRAQLSPPQMSKRSSYEGSVDENERRGGPSHSSLNDVPASLVPSSSISSPFTSPTSLGIRSKGKARADSPFSSDESNISVNPKKSKHRSSHPERGMKEKNKEKIPRKKVRFSLREVFHSNEYHKT